MWIDPSYSLDAVENELKAPEATAERVQELFAKWWGKRHGRPSLDGDVVVVPVKIVVTDFSMPGVPSFSRCGKLHFPKEKLSEEQIDLLEKDLNSSDSDSEADEFILWAAGRAAAIALVPLPLADVGPLMANEAYMIYKLADVYGYTIDKSVVTMLAGIAGGSIVGKIGASFLPFLKVPIAAGVTYAVGKAAKAYFASGMTLSRDALMNVFTNARSEADAIDWNKHKVEEPLKDEQE